MLNKGKNNNIQRRKKTKQKKKKETSEPSIVYKNLGKMSLTFCMIIESNSQKTFITIVLYTNMAAVTSSENRELIRI